jgi:aldose 1-epimerase
MSIPGASSAQPLVEAQNGELRLVVAPQTGASVVALEARRDGRWVPVLRPTPPEAVEQRNPSPMAMFLLAPWSNRIEKARFRWRGHDVSLRANTPEGYAIHGDLRRNPWRVVAADRTSCECRLASRDVADFNFPFPLEATVRYALDGARFTARLAVRNAGAEAMPCGLGFHPWFPRAGAAAGAERDARLRFAARAVYPQMPSGPTRPVPPEFDFARERPIGTCDLDHCFRDWDGRARLVNPAHGIASELSASATLGHVVVFTPPSRPCYAVEPVSICNNGFNLHAAGQAGSGTRELAPGDELVGEMALDVARL